MVVLATADTYGGVLTYATQLASGVKKEGINTVLAVFGQPLPRSVREQLDPGVEVLEAPYRLEWMENPWEDVARSLDWLAGLVDRLRPDVLHLNTYAHAAVPVAIPRLLVAHSCVASWWRAVHGVEAPAAYERYRAVVRAGLAAADVVIAPTAAFAEQIAALYGVVPTVIPNATAVPAGPIGARHEIVLAAGRLWDPAKNLRLLDAVAGRIRWPVWVAGEGRSPDGAFVRTGRVLRLGKLDRPELVEEMSRASVFCHPARYEPFGLAPLEAARRGCALVLSDLPTLREVWGEAARYASPDDPNGFAEAISDLMDDPQRREEAARAAQQRAAGFGLSHQVRQMCDLYRSLHRSRP